MLVCLAILVVGCGAEKATCETATDHVMSLQAAERTGRGEAPLAPGSTARRREQSIQHCQDRRVSQGVLDCLMVAANRDAVRGCDVNAP